MTIFKSGFLRGSLISLCALIPHLSNANCECACVNGSVQALCTSTIDLKPICSPQVCPIKPPSVRPIEKPTVPPIGASSCRNEQVYNPQKSQYEWKQICY